MFNLFNFSSQRLMQTAIQLLAVVAILPIHEFAHAFVANKLGDNTARDMGRLTINPIRHLDLFGTICLIFTGFGWAKPVPVNAGAFKNPKRGMAVVAAAGPIANFLLALVFIIIEKGIILIIGNNIPQIIYYVIQVFDLLAGISIALGIFNLIPIPPLDGSRIAGLFLPDKAYYGLMKYERFIMLAVFVLLATGVLSTPLHIATNFVYQILYYLTIPLDILTNLVH